MVGVMDNTALETLPKITEIFSPKGIKIEDILELRESNPNLTHKEIAKILGCERSNISVRLAKYTPAIKSLNRFKKYESSVLATVRKKVTDTLQELTPDELKAVSPRDLTVMYGVLYDKSALLDGKPTSVIAYADLCAGAEQVEARLQELGVKDMTLVEVEADSSTEGEAEGELLHPTYENLTTPRPRTPGGESGEE